MSDFSLLSLTLSSYIVLYLPFLKQALTHLGIKDFCAGSVIIGWVLTKVMRDFLIANYLLKGPG